MRRIRRPLGTVRREDDILMDRAHAAYLKARTASARHSALVDLLRVAEPFLKRVARHLQTGQMRDLEPDDALQQARTGFVDAVRRCDPSRAGSLRPFAINRIRHELQTLSERSYTIKVPRRYGVSESVMRDIEKLWAREGREPTRAELNGHAKAYDDGKLRPRVVSSLDAPHSESGDGLHDIVGSVEPSALDLLLEREERILGIDVGDRIEDKPRNARIVQPRKTMNEISHETNGASEDGKSIASSPLHDTIAYLKRLDDADALALREYERKTEETRKAREAMRSEFAQFASVLGFVPAVNAAPEGTVTAIRPPAVKLNQDKLPHRIVDFLKRNPQSKAGDIATALGADRVQISVELSKLRESKQVRSEGAARGTTYSLASRAA